MDSVGELVSQAHIRNALFFIASSMYDFANTIRIHATISHQPAERFSSFSSASAILRRFPQPVHVAHRWDAEEAFILTIEVGGVVVAHAVGRTGRVEVFAQHQPAGLLQPQPLLELQGTHLSPVLIWKTCRIRQSFSTIILSPAAKARL